MQLVIFNGFRVLIVHACHDITGAAVEHYQVIDISSGSGLVLSNGAVVNGTDCTFSGTCHAVADSVDCFNYGGTQSRLCAVTVFGGDLHLLIRQGIKRFR